MAAHRIRSAAEDESPRIWGPRILISDRLQPVGQDRGSSECSIGGMLYERPQDSLLANQTHRSSTSQVL